MRCLFPFRFEAWLVLGLVAFLEACGRGGVGGAVPGGPGSDIQLGKVPFPDAAGWLTSHLAVVMVAAFLALTGIVALMALALWVGSRATFVYIENVAGGRAELVRPWHAHAEQATSYFAWRFVLALVLLVAVVVLLALGLLAALSQSSGQWRLGAALALVVFIPIFLVLLLLSGLVSLALRDFVAPLQVERGLACRPAAVLLLDLVRRFPMAFFLYVALKIVFGLIQGTLLLAAACATCCLLLLPVVTQTFLQPLFFFERAWSLCLLRQLGHDVFAAFAARAQPPPLQG